MIGRPDELASPRPSEMDDGEELNGVVVEVLPRALYRVEVGPDDRIVAHLSRDPRRNFVRILKGDPVRVFRTARNRARGRITARRPA